MMLMEDVEFEDEELEEKVRDGAAGERQRAKQAKTPAPPKEPNATRGRASVAGRAKGGAKTMLAIHEAGEEEDDALEDLVAVATRAEVQRPRAQGENLFHNLVVSVPSRKPPHRHDDLPNSPTLRASAGNFIASGAAVSMMQDAAEPETKLGFPSPRAASRRAAIARESASPTQLLAAMDRARARVRLFVDQGMSWRSLFDEAAMLEPAEKAVPGQLSVKLFETCLCEGLGASREDCAVLSEAFSVAPVQRVHCAAFLEQLAPTWEGPQWESIERFRTRLLREAHAWGVEDSFDVLFADLTDAQSASNGQLRISDMRALARRLSCPEFSSAELDAVFQAMRPCHGKGHAVLLCDFASFLRDPRFQSDILPRLAAPLRAASSVDEIVEKLQNALAGARSMRSFRKALVDVGVTKLSREELNRVAQRFAKDSSYRGFHIAALVDMVHDFLANYVEPSTEENRASASPLKAAAWDDENTDDKDGHQGDEHREVPGDDDDGSDSELEDASTAAGSRLEQNRPQSARASLTARSSLQEASIESEAYIIDDDSDDGECDVERYTSAAFSGDAAHTTLEELKMDDYDDEPETLGEPATQHRSDTSGQDKPWFLRDNEISRRLAPARDDILDFAIYLGMDPEQDKAWLWLAEECLYAPLPKGWRQARDESTSGRGDVYYWREDDPKQKTQWEHPLDPFFRKLYDRLKQDKAQRVLDAKSKGRVRRGPRRQGASARPKSAHAASRDEDVEDSAELQVLRRIARRTAQLEPLDGPAPESVLGDGPLDPTAKRRPVSAIAKRSNRVMPAGNLLGGDDREEDEVSHVLTTQRAEKRKRKKNPRILPLGDLAGYAASISPKADQEAVDLSTLELPLPRPLPEDELRPVWWLCGSGQERRKLAGSDPASFRRQLAPEDVLDVANYLGLSLPADAHLMWIAKAAALTPIPPRWRLCLDEFNDEHFFANEETFAISRAHPLDPFWSLLLDAERVLGPRDGAEVAGEAWVPFYDEDEDEYYYEFSSGTTSYEPPASAGTVAAPAVVRAGCSGAKTTSPSESASTEATARREANAFRLSLWAELDGVDDLETVNDRARAPLARLLAWPYSQMLGKLELVKLTILLEWLTEPCHVALDASKRTRGALNSAVQARREAAEQLTKHITLRAR